MTSIDAPNCIDCIHFHDLIEKPKCEAFPEGIPDDIWLDGMSHTKPYLGDNGILFEKIK